ncbi:MAG: MBL fold metallo-hydrolase, partial [Prevotella sp.]|nr:MBL fold metallo-hydrolase [Prevotella sp.]
MITVKRFTCNMLAENCYVVSDDTNEAVIIDCGVMYEDEGTAIIQYIRDNNLNPLHLLCTHGHFDHCMGNGVIYKEFGLKPETHLKDQYLMENMAQQTADILGVALPMEVPPVGKYLSDSDVITFGNHTLRLLHTPGHTLGGVTYYCKEEGIAFSGDTLFRMSIGRTDFEGGSYEQMVHSLQDVLDKLPADTKVYPGHGPETTIAD